MFTKFVSRLLFIGVLFSIINCDPTDTSSTVFGDAPVVQNLAIQPSSVVFVPEDGFKDTTVSVGISALISVSEDYSAGYVVRDKQTGKLITKGVFDQLDDLFSGTPRLHEVNASIRTSTTAFENYIVEVYAYNTEAKGNFVQTSLSIQGISTSEPEIIKTTSPGTIIRPSSGAIPAVFTATVTDDDGDETIQGVFIRVIQNGVDVQGSPYNMFDDGSTSNDTTANDYTYTWSRDITATDVNPDRDFDIEFFALDISGLYSDTVRTTFQIRGN